MLQLIRYKTQQITDSLHIIEASEKPELVKVRTMKRVTRVKPFSLK